MGIMEKTNGNLIRSATTPQTQGRSNKENKEGQKKTKSVGFKEKLRSTFFRKNDSTLKKEDASDEITYGEIVVLGQAGVGKTSFIHRLVNNYFTDKYTPTTVSSSFDVTAIVECEDSNQKSRKEKIIDYAKSVRKSKSFRTSRHSQRTQQSSTKTFKFQLVDTTEDINESSPMMYRSTVANAHGFLLVVSSDKKESIKYVSQIYKDIAEMRKNTIVPVLIIQNKDDLHTGSIEDEQFESELEQLAVSLEIETCQISTANSSGFETLTELLLNEMNVYNDEYETEMSMPDDILYSYHEPEPEPAKVISNSHAAQVKRAQSSVN